MADEEIKADTTEESKGKSRRMSIVIVGLLMLGEGAAIYIMTNTLADSPASAAAAGDTLDGEAGSDDQAQVAEVDLVECKPVNRMSGRAVTLSMRVSGLVASEDLDRVTEMVESKRSRLLDRVNFVIRSADPKHLDEPGLETVKRRIKHELDRIFGEEDLVIEVLIPEMLQSGPGV